MSLVIGLLPKLIVWPSETSWLSCESHHHEYFKTVPYFQSFKIIISYHLIPSAFINLWWSSDECPHSACWRGAGSHIDGRKRFLWGLWLDQNLRIIKYFSLKGCLCRLDQWHVWQGYGDISVIFIIRKSERHNEHNQGDQSHQLDHHDNC